jgi:hypothetical protein
MFDPAMVVFAPFLMVIGIVWVTSRAKLEEKRIEAGKLSQVDPGAARRDERVEELEERVRVLERIVTDGGYDLASKIDALRDERPLTSRLQEREPEVKV